MCADPQAASSSPFSPRLAQLLAAGWVGAVLFAFLFHYDGWLVPIQFANLLRATMPTLAVGPYWSEFWRARAMDAGCVAGILVTAFGVGAVAINPWTREKDLLAALFSLATGLWILSLAILIVGTVSVLLLPWVYLLAGCWLLPAPRRFFHRPALVSEKLDGWATVMLACLIVAVMLNLLGAMTPPFEYDELEYHLGAPAEYLKAGHIIALPHDFYSNLPQLTEMLYLLALRSSSDIAAKLLHWSFGVLGAAAAYAVAVRLWTRKIAVTVAALFYCLPFVQDLSETARIDLATTFFATLAFGALLVWMEGEPSQDSRDSWLWLSAITAGCALATKWTAVPVVLFPAIACVLLARRVSLPVVYCLLSVLFVFPWLAKNWLLMGNPVYPLFNGVFHSPHWSAAQAALFERKHYASFGWDGWAQFANRAWSYSFPPAFDRAGNRIGGEQFTVPLLLLTAPLILLSKNATPSVRRAGWLFVTAYAGWFLLTFRPWRFLFPAFPLAAMLGAVALDAVGRWVRAVVVAVLLVGLSGMGLQALVDAEDPDRIPPQVGFVDYLLGKVSREDFIARMGHGTFEPIVWMNHHLPANAVVLYVGEARTYYARQRVLWSTAFDQHPLDALAHAPADPERWRQELRAQGVTHVYVNFSEWKRLRASYGYLNDIDADAFQRFLQDRARPIHVSGPGAVWELD